MGEKDMLIATLFKTCQATCVMFHPTSQKQQYARARADAHYDISTTCLTEYSWEMALALWLAGVIITIYNPHTRQMIPWVVRNPLGFEAI